MDLDSPSVASNYMDSKKKKKKEAKTEIRHKFVAKKPLKMATAAEQLADVKSANRTNLPKFKFGNPPSFDLRRAIQQKVSSEKTSEVVFRDILEFWYPDANENFG